MSLAVHVYSHHFGIYPWGVWTRAHTYSLIIAACKFFSRLIFTFGHDCKIILTAKFSLMYGTLKYSYHSVVYPLYCNLQTGMIK